MGSNIPREIIPFPAEPRVLVLGLSCILSILILPGKDEEFNQEEQEGQEGKTWLGDAGLSFV